MLKKYFQILFISYKNHTFYFYDFLWNWIIFILRIIIISLLFKSIYAHSQTDIISWFTVIELSIALVFAQTIAVSKPTIWQQIDSDIKSGKISSYMLNPISYIWFKFFENISTFLFNSLVFLPLWLWIVFLMFWYLPLDIFWILWAIILFLWALFINFFWYMIVWLIAFFTEDSESFRWIYSKADMIFWWNILPLPFLPGLMFKLAYILPFAYSWYTAWLVFSSFETNTFLEYFIIQWIWIFIFIILCSTIYYFARKKLTINWW